MYCFSKFPSPSKIFEGLFYLQYLQYMCYFFINFVIKTIFYYEIDNFLVYFGKIAEKMSYHNFKEVLINCDQYLANYARKKYYAPETPYVVIPHIVFVGRPEDYCRSVVGKPNKSQPHFVAKMQFSRSFTARYAVLQFLENEFLNDFLYFVNYHMSKYRFTKAKAIRNFCHTFEITEDDIAHDTLVKRFDRANKKKNFQWLKKA